MIVSGNGIEGSVEYRDGLRKLTTRYGIVDDSWTELLRAAKAEGLEVQDGWTRHDLEGELVELM